MADVLGYRRHAPGTQPDYLHPPYRSTVKRAPTKPLVPLVQTLSEVTGPIFGGSRVPSANFDLTKQHAGTSIGERIIVSGRVMDEDGRPLSDALVELWQCNSAGRYRHEIDQHDAPLDPNFSGLGHIVTDAAGSYRFITIRPGAYPWPNHKNAWRPSHLHFSAFGRGFVQRLVTQMYFPGDPLLPLDPIFNCVNDPAARDRMIAAFDIDSTVPDFALSYKFDIVLRGRNQTPMGL
ncbi:MAG: protocatechuate 3,4-dioxygenase subunit beta [Proteobacteria bacterium]|nr:protocatechuate 3,4-dioxygenase subunit beta [Pseudomonadota bacterium]